MGLDGGCARFAAKAEQRTETTVIEKPAAFYLMLDTSGSMDDNCSQCDGPHRWADASDAIIEFVQHPDSAGIGVALEFFSGSTCTGYDTPAVEMGTLPDHAPNIVAAIENASTSGNTPTEGALRGIAAYCAAYMAQHPEEVCVGVFVTDGEPNGCEENETALAQIVADALANDGVRTFAVGMSGADMNFLNRIAEAGNGDCVPSGPAWACDATVGKQSLITALQSIRETVVTEETITTDLPCEWGIPPPPDGMTFDPSLVNVEFTENGQNRQSLGKVPSGAECQNYSGGWYYDDPANPQVIHVCPDTCNVLQAIAGAHVDVIFGCESEPSILR